MIVKILKLNIYPTYWNIKSRGILLLRLLQLKVTLVMKKIMGFLKKIKKKVKNICMVEYFIQLITSFALTSIYVVLIFQIDGFIYMNFRFVLTPEIAIVPFDGKLLILVPKDPRQFALYKCIQLSFLKPVKYIVQTMVEVLIISKNSFVKKIDWQVGFYQIINVIIQNYTTFLARELLKYWLLK